MDPTASTFLSSIGAQFGFNALLVVGLLIGIAWLLGRQDKRFDKKDEDHRIERAQHLNAQIKALSEMTEELKINSGKIEVNTVKLDKLDDNINELRRGRKQ